MAIRANKKEIEFYFKIMEIRLIKKVKDSVKTTECLYQAWLFKDKAATDIDDNNALIKNGFPKVCVSPPDRIMSSNVMRI